MAAIRAGRRHLPHRRAGAGVVFLTWRLHHDQRPLVGREREQVHQVILRTPSSWCGVMAFVVMDDHVHVLVRLTAERTHARLAQAWKSISSHEIVRLGDRSAPLWQAEYFDRWMKDDRQIDRCIRYVIDNPARRWPDIGVYQWLHVADRPPKAV